MEDLVFSKLHIKYCNMCYIGCQFCNFGMVSKERKEKIESEEKKRKERERAIRKK